tara:strand:- start:1655 stop:2455 length:801 start_codon:yes stop_codon:yes gene_type:complete
MSRLILLFLFLVMIGLIIYNVINDRNNNIDIKIKKGSVSITANNVKWIGSNPNPPNPNPPNPNPPNPDGCVKLEGYPHCYNSKEPSEVPFDKRDNVDWINERLNHDRGQISSPTQFNKDTPVITFGVDDIPGRWLTIPYVDIAGNKFKDNFTSSVDCICDDDKCINQVSALMKHGAENISGTPKYQGLHFGHRGSVSWTHMHTINSDYTATHPSRIDSINIGSASDTNIYVDGDIGIAIKVPDNKWVDNNKLKTIATQVCEQRRKK